MGLSLCFVLSCGQRAMLTDSSTDSITPRGAKVAKWFVTISVGLSVDTSATLHLRNVLADVFPKTQGGLYQHVIDMDDKRSGSIAPNKKNILKQIADLTETIKKYKQENPGAKTMVAFGLTGHGMTSGNTYYYSTTSGSLSGTEIVKFIKGLGTDETILIVQSCESGSLPNIHFQNNSLFGLAQDIQAKAKAADVALSVVVPVSADINSPLDTWEEDIVKPSLTDEKADKNKDGIVTYEEWKNFLMQTACKHPEYKTGIDPQIYDPKVPGGLPFVLTAEGTRRYENNTLTLPDYPLDPAKLWPETVKICASSENPDNTDNSDSDTNDDSDE